MTIFVVKYFEVLSKDSRKDDCQSINQSINQYSFIMAFLNASYTVIINSGQI